MALRSLPSIRPATRTSKSGRCRRQTRSGQTPGETRRFAFYWARRSSGCLTRAGCSTAKDVRPRDWQGVRKVPEPNPGNTTCSAIGGNAVLYFDSKDRKNCTLKLATIAQTNSQRWRVDRAGGAAVMRCPEAEGDVMPPGGSSLLPASPGRLLLMPGLSAGMSRRSVLLLYQGLKPMASSSPPATSRSRYSISRNGTRCLQPRHVPSTH